MPTTAESRRKSVAPSRVVTPSPAKSAHPAKPVRPVKPVRSAKAASSRRKPVVKPKKPLDPMRQQQADEYSELRRKRGSKEEVSAKLGIDRSTLFRRETGDLTVNREAILALKSLTVKATPSED